MAVTHPGGCLCGAIRYAAGAEPVDTGYCHCRLCQRSTGAPVLAWASFPVDVFSYTLGAPARYQSSPHGHREFCSECGTQIAYRDSENARTVDVNTGSLDDPDRLAPRCHIWHASRLSWFDTADDLPRFEASKPQDERG